MSGQEHAVEPEERVAVSPAENLDGVPARLASAKEGHALRYDTDVDLVHANTFQRDCPDIERMNLSELFSEEGSTWCSLRMSRSIW